MDDLAHVCYAFGQKWGGCKMAYTLPLTGEVRWKCHLINAASAQMPSHKCSVSTKRRNSENNECLYNNIWGCTKYQRFPSRKRTKEKTSVYYCKIQENIKINALLASLSRLTASTEVENKVSTIAQHITKARHLFRVDYFHCMWIRPK